jgi:hypothetical protein
MILDGPRCLGGKVPVGSRLSLGQPEVARMRISNLHDREDEFVPENDKLYILREITWANYEPIGESQRVRGTSCYVVAGQRQLG